MWFIVGVLIGALGGGYLGFKAQKTGLIGRVRDSIAKLRA